MTQDTAINQPPKVLLWFKIYCGFVCLLYLATAAFSLFFFLADPSDTEMSQSAGVLIGVLLLVVGLLFSVSACSRSFSLLDLGFGLSTL